MDVNDHLTPPPPGLYSILSTQEGNSDDDKLETHTREARLPD